MVTVVGNVVDSPRRVSLDRGAVTNFRLASTSRRYDTTQETFVDSGTFWVDVECWGALSGNVSASLSKGDPVVVHGTLTTHSWDSESGPRSKPRIKALAVGPNLQKGRAQFTRDKGVRAGEETASMPPAGDGADEPRSSRLDEPEVRAGRDYEAAADALDPVDADGLPGQPAHV
jgi:single-strand DNA-binding protein